jgi:HSP20 family protein
VERFGNVRPSREGFVVDEVREPLADVFDERDEVVVTAELPGAKEAEITVELKGDMLTIESKGERHYAKEIVLPVEVDAASLRKKYNNGVLEIRVRKKAKS